MADELRLVPARPEHVDFWMVLRAEPASRRFVMTDGDTRASLLRRIQDASGDVNDPLASSFRWMVEYQGRLVGTVSARELSRSQGRIEVGYMMAEALHGQGLGTRAVGMMLERLFSLPFLHRVWLVTSSNNLASQAVARKLGFTREGVLRDHYLQEGQRVDQQVWGLLRPEWEALRASAGRVHSRSA
jgi:ribosomal-protein-alanine N-acetyltransferase